MRYLAVVIVVLTATFSSYSQTYEFGGFIGGANYVGDVGRTNYIAPKTPAFGAIFKWNRSLRHAFRGSITFARIEGDDIDSEENRRKERGYSFSNNILEASLGIELTFWDYKVHSGKPVSAPYLYTGITYFTYDALFKDANDAIEKYDTAGSFAIPMIVGFKATPFNGIAIGMEIGARYTFTDDLDGSFPVKGLKNDETLRFGNINSDDWYVFTGVSIAFTFGRRPCYCNF